MERFHRKYNTIFDIKIDFKGTYVSLPYPSKLKGVDRCRYCVLLRILKKQKPKIIKYFIFNTLHEKYKDDEIYGRSYNFAPNPQKLFIQELKRRSFGIANYFDFTKKNIKTPFDLKVLLNKKPNIWTILNLEYRDIIYGGSLYHWGDKKVKFNLDYLFYR